MISLIKPALIGFLSVVFCLLLLRPIAPVIGLLDHPGGRKRHMGSVPVVGGIGLFIGSVGVLAWTGQWFPGAVHMMVAAGFVVGMGALDDRFHLSPYLRMGVQFGAAIAIVLGTGHTVVSLGNLLGFGEIALGPADVAFTAIAAMALINAFNMLDGLDGIAAAVALVALGGLAGYFLDVVDPVAFWVTSVLAGGAAGFLMFNAPVRWNRRHLCFLGDAGSTLLGLALVCVCLVAVQPGPRRLPPAVVLWMMPVPIIELFTSTIRRALRGQSPLQADRGHFHHRLLVAGFSVRAIFLMYVLTSAASAVVGLGLWRSGVSESVVFFGFVALSAVWIAATGNAARLAEMLPERLKRRLRPPTWEVAAAGSLADAADQA